MSRNDLQLLSCLAFAKDVVGLVSSDGAWTDPSSPTYFRPVNPIC